MVLPMILPALIGGAISGLGGALKASAQKRAQDEYLAEYAVYKQNVENTPQVTTNVTTGNLAQLVAASEAAGFNPVTVLRSGGLAYFNDTVTTAPKLWVPPAPREGFSPFGEFAQGFGQSVSSIDLSAMYANMAQAGLAQAQTLSLSQRPAGVAHIAAQRSGGAAVLGTAAAAGRTLFDQDGATIPVGPGSQAEDWEAEYGEIAGELEGFPRYLRDRVYPALTNPETYGLPSDFGAQVRRFFSPVAPGNTGVMAPALLPPPPSMPSRHIPSEYWRTQPRSPLQVW